MILPGIITTEVKAEVLAAAWSCLCHCEEPALATCVPGQVPVTRQSLFKRMEAMERCYYVYILTNKVCTVLYTGVTNNLKRRVYEHKAKLADGFTKRYNVNMLVYYEAGSDIKGAILREKQIKAGSRQNKIDLINAMNKDWRDLYNDL